MHHCTDWSRDLWNPGKSHVPWKAWNLQEWRFVQKIFASQEVLIMCFLLRITHSQMGKLRDLFKLLNLPWRKLRNYHSQPKWIPGKITRQIGWITYLVQVKHRVWKRHTNQLRINKSNDWDYKHKDSDLPSTSENMPMSKQETPPQDESWRYPIRERYPPDRYGFQARRNVVCTVDLLCECLFIMSMALVNYCKLSFYLVLNHVNILESSWSLIFV